VIKFANLGNQSARKVIVSLYLDPSLEIAHSDPQASRTVKNKTYPGGVMNWDVGDLDVGMSQTIHAVIHATSMPDEGALVTAIIAADGLDNDSTNNTASLLLRSPSLASTLKSKQPSAGVNPVGLSEKPSVRPVSHSWRNFFGLVLVVGAVLIFFRARRKR
jgi:Domain of unknown function DUF11